MCHMVSATGYGNMPQVRMYLLYRITVALRLIHMATYLHQEGGAWKKRVKKFVTLSVKSLH